MSMISEQISYLRELGNDLEVDMVGVNELNKAFNDAANTIEELSAKLANANMERSTAYYNDGWIPCSERLPNNTADYLVTYSNGEIGIHRYICYKYRDFWRFYSSDLFPIAWMPLPALYQPKGE